jgi:hypothetical protein
MVIEFSPAADSEWEQILTGDRVLAEAIDPLFDRIESGELPGQMFANHARFATLRLPGRDELYCIVWEIRQDYLYVLRVGRV